MWAIAACEAFDSGLSGGPERSGRGGASLDGLIAYFRRDSEYGLACAEEYRVDTVSRTVSYAINFARGRKRSSGIMDPLPAYFSTNTLYLSS